MWGQCIDGQLLLYYGALKHIESYGDSQEEAGSGPSFYQTRDQASQAS
jgi:hypothetical protein